MALRMLKNLSLILAVLSALCFGQRMYDFGEPVVTDSSVAEPVAEEPAVAKEPTVDSVAAPAPLTLDSTVQAAVDTVAEPSVEPVAEPPAQEPKANTVENVPEQTVAEPVAENVPYKAVGKGLELTPIPDEVAVNKALDSARYYDDRADKLEAKSAWLRNLGTPFVFAGGVVAGAGVLMLVSGLAENSSVECEKSDGQCKIKGSLMGPRLAGDLMVLVGALGAATGITLKITGEYQLKEANHLRTKAQKFKDNSNVYISLVPQVDVVNRRFGSVALLSF